MGIKTIKLTEDLLIEEGKTYDTKNGQGLFIVKKISINKNGRQMTAWGTYLKSNQDNCPIDVGRLVVEKKITGESQVCDCCLLPLNKKYAGKKYIEF